MLRTGAKKAEVFKLSFFGTVPGGREVAGDVPGLTFVSSA